jgi:hypothetical protein
VEKKSPELPELPIGCQPMNDERSSAELIRSL